MPTTSPLTGAFVSSQIGMPRPATKPAGSTGDGDGRRSAFNYAGNCPFAGPKSWSTQTDNALLSLATKHHDTDRGPNLFLDKTGTYNWKNVSAELPGGFSKEQCERRFLMLARK